MCIIAEEKVNPVEVKDYRGEVSAEATVCAFFSGIATALVIILVYHLTVGL